MRRGALRKRAEAAGASKDELEEADDEDDTKLGGLRGRFGLLGYQVRPWGLLDYQVTGLGSP